MASPQSLSSAGAPVGMPGTEREMFVRCSDPDIICETKHMVMVTLRIGLSFVSCRGLAGNALCPQNFPIISPW